MTGRRAIVCYVEDNRHLVQQLLALRLSLLHAGSSDTDLVKIPQRPAVEDPVWQDYRFVNSAACLNGAGAEQLDRYPHLLRTDVDTFVTPPWHDFRPEAFTCGHGTYSHNDDVRQRIRAIAVQYGLAHRGLTNVGSTWYGPTEVVRRTGAFTGMLTTHLLTQHFATDHGTWPGWFRGVALLYSSEIAVNHCAPDAQLSGLLDAMSSSQESPSRFAHIHCWHSDLRFSKHAFMGGRYTAEDAQNLNPDAVADYCLALSFQSLIALEDWLATRE